MPIVAPSLAYTDAPSVLCKCKLRTGYAAKCATEEVPGCSIISSPLVRNRAKDVARPSQSDFLLPGVEPLSRIPWSGVAKMVVASPEAEAEPDVEAAVALPGLV